MADNDDLYFSFDEEEEEAGEAETVEVEEKQNRSFLIGAIILALVFLVGIALVAVFFLFLRQPPEPAVADIELTNQANMTLFAMTQAAALEETLSPPIEEEPEEQGLSTPTPGVDEPAEEPEAGEEATEVAEVTSAPEEEGEPGAPTPLAEETAVPTSGIIEVTPLGDGPAAPETTPAEGVIEPTQPALPDTGFAGTAGLAGAGLVALMLVAVVVAARRIRMR